LKFATCASTTASHPALWRVSLAIGAGELVCVVGPNGAGKTTLINAIAGLHRPRRDASRMDGCEMTALPPRTGSARLGVAIVPEGRRLFPRMTVRENLEIGSYVRAARATRRQSLDSVCALFPAVRDKLDAPAGSPVRRPAADGGDRPAR
jgi:branched-chain amino acid transport system ATP-binding protein